jgi:iron complex outermembrane receptor protein
MIEGTVDGVEVWGTYQPTAWLRVTAGGTWLDKDLRLEPGSTDPTGPQALGNDPRYQVMARVSAAFGADVDADVMIRRVGALPAPAVPAYNAVDARIGWRVAAGIELSIGVRNAFDPDHVEFNAPATANRIPRSAYARISWTL